MTTEHSTSDTRAGPRSRAGLMALALLGAVAGGWAGYHNVKPLYRAEGLIQVTAPESLREGGTVPVPVREDYVRAQAALAASPSVAENAMGDSMWRAVGRGEDAASLVLFMRHVQVDAQGVSLVHISFTDA